jgi:membrane protein YdbS with pleckstrin-like domain
VNDKYLERVLGTQEKVNFVTRQHWLLLLGSISLEVVIIAVLFLGVIALSKYTQLALIGLSVIIIPGVSILRDYLSWDNKRFIVTNRRVIHTSGVFNKNIVDSSLEKVNDVKMDQSFLGRIFNFGNIEILTASELGVNIFSNIGNPIKFKTSMLNAKELLTLDEGIPEKANRSGDIPGLIERLGQLRQQGILSEQEFNEKKKDLLEKL